MRAGREEAQSELGQNIAPDGVYKPAEMGQGYAKSLS